MKTPSVLVKTVGLLGLVPHLKVLTVHAAKGTGVFNIVGLGDVAQSEIRVCVRSALATNGVSLDGFAITVTASPPDLSPSADLAIAVGVLAAVGKIPVEAVSHLLFIGELSLDGRLRAVRGLSAMWGQEIVEQSSGAIVSEENRGEACLRPTAFPVMTASDLVEVVSHLKGEKRLSAPVQSEELLQEASPKYDFGDIPPGLPRRALEVAAAGGHNIHLVGALGSQTMMLARRLPSILPRLTSKEQFDIIRINSIAGLLSQSQRYESRRPFRAPHHTVSDPELQGGGLVARPGEMTLAHNGVLLLDDACEFRRSTLEGMREGLTTGLVRLRSGERGVVFPSRFLLVAATFSCPCGRRNSSRPCACSDAQIAAYQNRLAPLAPFLDLRVEVPFVPVPEMLHRPALTTSESTVEVRLRVTRARERQTKRQKNGEVGVSCNGLLTMKEAERLAGGMSQSLSVLRVALTLADLEGVSAVGLPHVLEALRLVGSPGLKSGQALDQKEANGGERKEA